MEYPSPLDFLEGVRCDCGSDRTGTTTTTTTTTTAFHTIDDQYLKTLMEMAVVVVEPHGGKRRVNVLLETIRFLYHRYLDDMDWSHVIDMLDKYPEVRRWWMVMI